MNMNLNEKCLLKYLTNPIGSFSKDDEKHSNIISGKDFISLNNKPILFKEISLVK